MKRKETRKKGIVVFIGILFINLIIFNSLLLNSPFLNSETPNQNENNFQDFYSILNTQGQGANISLLHDPYTLNFNDTWHFFDENFESDLNYLYYGEGDVDGTITEDLIYSLDNLLLYNTLLKQIYDYDSSEILEKYLALKDTSLWYQGSSEYEYGFINSVDNTTGTINSFQRVLIDNLMPIFLLGENIEGSVSGSYKTELENAFTLINSTQFLDINSEIFYHTNSSSGEIYALDNLYAVLANLLINQTDGLDDAIKVRAGILANQTMETLSETFWDSINLGYDYSASSALSITNNNKYLETNALGIITLLEYWKINNKSEYIANATSLYNNINNTLWYEFGTNGLYTNRSSTDWSGNITDDADLKANAMMMRACLELFEVSGNRSYYNRAIELYNAFEDIFYDTNNNAYAKSKSTEGIDDKKNHLYNLRVCEAYLYALEIYDNSSISCSFNKSEQVPEFIFNQESLVITSNYSYNSFYGTFGIPNATLTYTIRDPSGDILETLNKTTNENGTHTLTYLISNELP
ncbi:MAG: hypothetical protein EU544_06820, partial [Promethearchaeota archaeon]